jgi:hypothetical protein
MGCKAEHREKGSQKRGPHHETRSSAMRKIVVLPQLFIQNAQQ